MQLPQNFNPHAIAIKKYLVQTLPDKCNNQTMDMIDRIAHILVTKRDMETFIKLIADLYQGGYTKAIEVTSEKLEQQGIKLKFAK